MPRPKLEFESLGTHWWIEIFDDLPAAAAYEAVLARVDAFHDDYSRFIPGSYVGRLNSHKQLKNPPQELIDMLLFARDMHIETDGIFNISVGAILGQLGYGTAEAGSNVRATMWDNTVIDQKLITIPADIEVDLGGFGKGWIIDQIGVLLRNMGHPFFLINGGGDILVSSEKPIELALEHPVDTTKMIGTTRITSGALAVSSTKKRVWKQGDTTHHHIIDPRTHMPSQSDIASTYVKADSALIADTLATVILIDPAQNDRLSKKYDLQTIVISEDQLISA